MAGGAEFLVSQLLCERPEPRRRGAITRERGKRSARDTGTRQPGHRGGKRRLGVRRIGQQRGDRIGFSKEAGPELVRVDERQGLARAWRIELVVLDLLRGACCGAPRALRTARPRRPR